MHRDSTHTVLAQAEREVRAGAMRAHARHHASRGAACHTAGHAAVARHGVASSICVFCVRRRAAGFADRMARALLSRGDVWCAHRIRTPGGVAGPRPQERCSCNCKR